MPYETVERRTVDDLLAYLRLSEDHWGQGLPRSSWVFRGMPDAEWDLVPSAHRDAKHRSAFFAELYDWEKSVADSQPQLLTFNLADFDRVTFDQNPARA